eukprot:CAMPEP_0117034352 /NCGR_PEP_ID=MMETSP0472-20121206/24465_1 /TAXON_ID=693140 ORGANISM="Tiarina fusus, Strain LIS" /NCGR_SAMPLE_ID=MMETSP0472 /ASSEMBLY_ACC=CAM_ASM_000603 /LENGTH=75 /DNA_ID=CAMNT_0004743501 /DNA_START=377 /DNA_END=604 /DNA_ORIENTATION=+
MTLRSFNTPNEEPITPTRTVEASISPETELVFIDAEEEWRLPLRRITLLHWPKSNYRNGESRDVGAVNLQPKKQN